MRRTRFRLWEDLWRYTDKCWHTATLIHQPILAYCRYISFSVHQLTGIKTILQKYQKKSLSISEHRQVDLRYRNIEENRKRSGSLCKRKRKEEMQTRRNPVSWSYVSCSKFSIYHFTTLSLMSWLTWFKCLIASQGVIFTGFVSRNITLIASVDRTKTKNTKAVTTNIRPVNAFRRHTYIRLVYIDEYFI